MGTAAYGAQDTPDPEKDLCPVCLDMAEVGAIADEGTQAAAGAGKACGFHLRHDIVIRFLGNRVAFTDRYGYHNLAGGLNP
ncbi:MAG: hypothetical protein NC548_63030 [Lachnospiraceae bacterium]|nr:hypothetical protein [Lachnospiraceae bacterium]